MDKLLELKALSVGYRRRAVVGDASLELAPGQILSLIGPNGAGKSTLLKTIARQLSPLSGAAYLDGRELSQMPEKESARALSILLTHRPSPELMRCRDVVAAGRYPYTGRLGILSREDEREVERAMELVGVTSLAEQDFTRVSDGERQLVMLARAVCQRPRLLVLDEPTSFLDIRHKLALLSVLKTLAQEEGLAVLMSLHELDLAAKVSDLVACVSFGRIDRVGPPEAVLSGEYIQKVYGVQAGAWNEAFGSPELERPKGEPRLFVIGGGGGGIPVYRRLQRQGVPFYAGVLHENDVETPVARALAARVVLARAFAPIGEEELAEAEALLKACERALCCVTAFGPMNEGNRRLLALAEERGVLERV